MEWGVKLRRCWFGGWRNLSRYREIVLKFLCSYRKSATPMTLRNTWNKPFLVGYTYVYFVVIIIFSGESLEMSSLRSVHFIVCSNIKQHDRFSFCNFVLLDWENNPTIVSVSSICCCSLVLRLTNVLNDRLNLGVKTKVLIASQRFLNFGAIQRSHPVQTVDGTLLK